MADITSTLLSPEFHLLSGRLPAKTSEIVITDYGRIIGLPNHGVVKLGGQLVLAGLDHPGHDRRARAHLDSRSRGRRPGIGPDASGGSPGIPRQRREGLEPR